MKNLHRSKYIALFIIIYVTIISIYKPQLVVKEHLLSGLLGSTTRSTSWLLGASQLSQEQINAQAQAQQAAADKAAADLQATLKQKEQEAAAEQARLLAEANAAAAKQAAAKNTNPFSAITNNIQQVVQNATQQIKNDVDAIAKAQARVANINKLNDIRNSVSGKINEYNKIRSDDKQKERQNSLRLQIQQDIDDYNKILASV